MREKLSVKTKSAVFLGVTIAFALALALYVGSLLMGESVYSNRGSIAYWLTITSVEPFLPTSANVSTSRFIPYIILSMIFFSGS